MNLSENIKPTGAFTVQVFDKDGNLKAERHVKNVVVTAGKNYLASWLAAASQAGYFMQYLALGSGTTGALAANTALETELHRKAGTISSSTNVWQNTATFGAGEATGNVSEAGIFSASSSGTMLARQTFTAIPKGATDTMVVTWQITLS